MTSNSLKAQSNKIEQDKLSEEKRFHRSREKAQNFKDVAGGIKDTVGSAAKSIAASKLLGGLIAANDPAWYTQDKQLTKDVGSLSFARPLGLPFTINTASIDIPSIAIHTFVPTIGTAGIANIAASNVYAYVRYKNSGHANYDAPDLMQYLLAVDSLFTAWATGVRLYGALKYVNTMNRASQQRLITALGFNYDDCVAHINDLRSYLNQLRLRLSPFYLPKDLTYYQRHMWLATNIFSEDKLQKSQLHAYRCGVYHVYTEQDGILEPHQIVLDRTFSQYVTMCETILAPLVASESIGIMSGDILKAYGDGNTVSLSVIDEDYSIVVQYSDEVLEQLQNATTFATFGSQWEFGFTIGQTSTVDSTIVQGLRFTEFGEAEPWITKAPTPSYSLIASVGTYWTRMSSSGPLMLSAKDDQPSSDRVFTSTRLMAPANPFKVSVTRDAVTEAYAGLSVATCGSEVIIDSRIYNSTTSYLMADGSTFGTTAIDLGRYVTTLSAFGTYPAIRLADVYASSTAVPPTAVYTRINGENVIPVSIVELAKLHDVALMSMFGLPYTAAQNKPALR